MKRDRHTIQKYLDLDLSDKDMKRFEADLEASPGLQADLNLYREVDEAIADTEVLAFRDQLNDLRKDSRQSSVTKKVQIRFTRPWHYAATAAVALILAIGFASILDRPLSNKDLLKKYYKPYEVALINRSNDAQLDLMLRHAQQLYQEGEFSEAVVYFERVLEEKPEQVATNLYTGISYFEMEKYQAAGKSLNKVIEHHDNLYVDQADWYLAFCFLATEENDRARRQFARIASSNSFYRKDAEKILRKLDK
jgi:tetratricopeptide (TPR) repeat protein